MNGDGVLAGGVRRLRYGTRAVMSAHPSVFIPYARRRYAASENRVVRPETELVIDGFQRSANTFAVVAFELAQRRPVRTAHHLHAVAQIRAAVKLGVPTILLIRDPDECTSSHVIRKPFLSPGMVLSSWTRFYAQLLPYRDGLLTADFRDVTSDFGAVVRRANRMFGTDFDTFDHTDENVAACFRRIDEANGERNGRIVETLVARPSPEREGLKPAVRRELEGPGLERLRARAYAVYRQYGSPSPDR
jgi:hypothetical protein